MSDPPTRRAFLKWTAIGAAAILLPLGIGSGYLWARASRGNVGRVDFASPLRIPPIAPVSSGAEKRRVLDLAIQEGRSRFRSEGLARTWGVNQAYLGPTIRVRRGETIAPRVRNLLPEPTSLHWHGMELPAASDGGPHQRIEPGEVWEPVWRIEQPAATLWYHPHLHGTTKEHVYRGVAGLLLIDDDTSPGLHDEYGVDDIPVIIQDKKFTGDGDLDPSGISFGGLDVVGMLGDEILINGTWGPILRVRRKLTRLRVLNASNGRVYRLTFDDRREFHVVGTDVGLLPRPFATDEIQLSPGERAELVVRMRPAERIRLCSEPPELTGNFLYEHFAGGDDRFELLQLEGDPELEPSSPLPAAFPTTPPVAAPAPARAPREFVLGEVTINSQTIDMHRTDVVVETGSTEEWSVHNAADTPHNFHVHNARFDIIDIDAQPPKITGPKDTVYVAPGARVRLRVHFGQYPDPHTPYMYHCHVLAHEDAGVMGQFVIVDPGTTAPDVAITPHTHQEDHDQSMVAPRHPRRHPARRRRPVLEAGAVHRGLPDRCPLPAAAVVDPDPDQTRRRRRTRPRDMAPAAGRTHQRRARGVLPRCDQHAHPRPGLRAKPLRQCHRNAGAEHCGADLRDRPDAVIPREHAHEASRRDLRSSNVDNNVRSPTSRS